MEWNKERVRELRLRMGWSHSDLARHLQVEVNMVQQIENGLFVELDHVQSKLTLFWKQAEMLSDEVQFSALAEHIIEEQNLSQLFQSDLPDKYIESIIEKYRNPEFIFDDAENSKVLDQTLNGHRNKKK